MMAETPAAFGLYPSTRALHCATEALRAAQFRQTDISVMYSDGHQALELREGCDADDGEADGGVADDDVTDDGVADVAPRSLAGMLSGLSGIGAIATRNDGPFMAAGPILATLAHRGAELVSSLRGLGIPEGLVSSFERRLKQGGLLLTVQCDDTEWAARAQRIFQETGAEHVVATV